MEKYEQKARFTEAQTEYQEILQHNVEQKLLERIIQQQTNSVFVKQLKLHKLIKIHQNQYYSVKQCGIIKQQLFHLCATVLDSYIENPALVGYILPLCSLKNDADKQELYIEKFDMSTKLLMNIEFIQGVKPDLKETQTREQVIVHSITIFLIQYFMQLDIRSVAYLCGGVIGFYQLMYASHTFNFKRLSNIALAMSCLNHDSTLKRMSIPELQFFKDLQPIFTKNLHASVAKRQNFADLITTLSSIVTDIKFVGIDPKQRFEEVTGRPLDKTFFTLLSSDEYADFACDCVKIE